MNNIYKKGAALALCSLATVAAAAQNTYSGYFLENYTYRSQMNPAFGSDRNYVGFPGLGNINIATRGNLHTSAVFYNLDGRTVLFTNPGVGIAEAMGKFHDDNRIQANLKLNILNAGFKAFGGYNTVGINAVANVGAGIPGSFFSLAKEGVANKTYDISNLRAHADAYAEVAFNHSREIKQVKGLRVGAAVKFLVGAGNLDAYFHEADLTLGDNSWTARTNADIYASVKGLTYSRSTNENTGHEYVSGAEMGTYGPNGFGMAFDLGAEYEWSDWNFSAALIDLGFISWGNTQWATTGGTKTVNTDAFTFNVDDDASNSFDNELDRLRNQFSELYELEDRGDSGSRARMLGATLNLAAQYRLPMYKKLSFGLLNSTRIQGAYTLTQFRLSANVAPVKCFSAGANVAVGTFGWSFGWVANVKVTGFNLFLGMDHTLGKLAKPGVPLNSNMAVNFGIDFPF